MVLTSILKHNAQKFPHQTALTMRMGYRTVSLTFLQVYELSRKVAVFLAQLGIKPGDRVVIVAPNSPYWICLMWGCLLRGVVIVPLTIQSLGKMVQKIIQQTDAQLLFKYTFFRQDCGPIKTFDIELLPELVGFLDPAAMQEYQATEDDLMQILYTSGTTGDPKGVMLTHNNIYSNMIAVAKIFPFHGKERVLSLLPLSHILEQTIGFFLPFYLHAQIIYAHSHTAIRSLLQEYRITKLITVPEFLKVFMAKIEDDVEVRGKKKLFESMQKISKAVASKWLSRLMFRPILKSMGGKLDIIACGGAALDPLLEEKWQALGIKILQGYGLTETSPVLTYNSLKAHRVGSVGKVLPGVQLSIADDGEILVKGPNIFKGYYNNEEKTRAAFSSEGWFRTGDIGSLDSDGFLYLKGRQKYMILGPGGQNVFPEDIEGELNELPGVKDSCVLGLEQPGGQIQIHAVLLLDDGAGPPDQIVAHANNQLTSYQQIGGWSVWQDIDFPRTATRKIKKEEVKKFIASAGKQTVDQSATFKSPLMRIIAQMSGRDLETINAHTTLGQLQFDSLLTVELIMRIEQNFAAAIDETLITPKTSVADLEEMIAKKEPVKLSAPLKKWPAWFLVRGMRIFFQSFFLLFARLFMKVRVHGKNHLKNFKGPVIFMPNHTSYIDPLALIAALPWRIRWRLAFAAANDMLYGTFSWAAIPGEFLMHAFPFPRHESENIQQGLDTVGRLLDKKISVVLFPEGMISETGDLLPLKGGAGLLAIEMGVPIIPVSIIGSQTICPYDTMMPRSRGAVDIVFGEPLLFSRKESYVQATERIADALKNCKP
ncbi:AMP-binding protein [Candidatus Babeliales bacterium]|nr:AMP-binding protein [Candidatus Babeliales bacterium]